MEYITQKEARKLIGVAIKGLEYIKIIKKNSKVCFMYKIDEVQHYQQVLDNTLYPKQIDYRLLRHQGYTTMEDLLDDLGVKYVTPLDMPGLIRTKIYKSEEPKIREYYKSKEAMTNEKRNEDDYKKFLSNTNHLNINKKAPVTNEEYHKFVRTRTNNTKKIATALIGIEVKIISQLHKELYLMDAKKIQYFASLLHIQQEKQEFALFINYLKTIYDIPYQVTYNRSSITRGARTKGRYRSDEWRNFAKLLFVESDNQVELMNRAIKSRTCAMIYLYCAMHFVSGMRSADIIKFVDQINLKAALDKSNEEIFELIKTNNFTEAMSKRVVNQLVNKLNQSEKNPTKTSKKTNTVISLEISESFIYVIGKLLALCQIHKEKKEKKKIMELSIRDTRCYHKLFYGLDKEALGDYFYSSRANKTYLHFIAKTSQDMNYNIGIFLAGIERAHKMKGSNRFSETTQGYLASEAERREREKIELGLFERGVFGFMLRMMLEALYGGCFSIIEREEQDKILQLYKTLTPSKIEVSLRSLEVQVNKAKEIVSELISCKSKDDIKDILIKLRDGLIPAKLPYTHCIAKATGKGCVYPYKLDCISCKYVLVEKLVLLQLDKLLSNAINTLQEIDQKYDIRRYSYLINHIYIPLICEAIEAFGEEVKDFIDIDKYNKALNELYQKEKYY